MGEWFLLIAQTVIGLLQLLVSVIDLLLNRTQSEERPPVNKD
jgi:hypothetical protein